MRHPEREASKRLWSYWSHAEGSESMTVWQVVPRSLSLDKWEETEEYDIFLRLVFSYNSDRGKNVQVGEVRPYVSSWLWKSITEKPQWKYILKDDLPLLLLAGVGE